MACKADGLLNSIPGVYWAFHGAMQGLKMLCPSTWSVVGQQFKTQVPYDRVSSHHLSQLLPTCYEIAIVKMRFGMRWVHSSCPIPCRAMFHSPILFNWIIDPKALCEKLSITEKRRQWSGLIAGRILVSKKVRRKSLASPILFCNAYKIIPFLFCLLGGLFSQAVFSHSGP